MKVEYVDHMGTDLSIVDAARISFAKKSGYENYCWNCGYSSQKWEVDICPECGKDCGGRVNGDGLRLAEGDVKLIKFLARHNHYTPFCHNAISLRMQAPVPVRTQSFKHKQGLVENEESRRYISCRPELFIPESFRESVKDKKQGSGGTHPDSECWLATYKKKCGDMIDTYEHAIRSGVCPEQARFFLPQGVEVNWVWTGNLYAFANFYNKRTAPDAQKEIQDLAKGVGAVVRRLFPVSWKALVGE